MSRTVPLEIAAQLVGGATVISQLSQIKRGLTDVGAAQQTAFKRSAMDIARKHTTQELQYQRSQHTQGTQASDANSEQLSKYKQSAMLAPISKLMPGVKAAAFESGAKKLYTSRLDKAKEQLEYTKKMRVIVDAEIKVEKEILAAQITNAALKGDPKAMEAAKKAALKWSAEAAEQKKIGDAELTKHTRNVKKAEGKVEGVSTLRGAAFSAVKSHPVAAGIAAISVAAVAGVTGIKLYAQHLEKLALTFSKTRGTQQGMMQAFKDARKIYADTSLSMKSSVDITNQMGYAAEKNGVRLRDLGKTVEALKVGYEMSDDAAENAVKDLLVSGNTDALQKGTGLTQSDLKKLLGREGSGAGGTLTTEEIMEAVMTATAPAMSMKNRSIVNKISKYFKDKMGKFDVGLLKADKFLGGVFETAKDRDERQQAEVLSRPGGKVAVNTESMNYINALRDSESNLDSTLKKLDAMRHRWGQLLGQVHAYNNALYSMRQSIKTSVRGGVGEITLAGSAARHASQGADLLSGGGISGMKSPEAAMKAYQASTGATTNLISKFKSGQMRLSGQTAFGEYSGSRATGREAYLIRKEQQFLKKGAIGELGKAAGAEGIDEKEKEKILELKKGMEGAKSPAEVIAALEEYATYTADKAEEAAKAHEEYLKRQLAAQEATKAELEDKLPKILTAVEGWVDHLDKLSPEVRRKVEASPEFQRVMAKRAEDAALVELTGLKTVKDKEAELPENLGAAEGLGSASPLKGLLPTSTVSGNAPTIHIPGVEDKLAPAPTFSPVDKPYETKLKPHVGGQVYKPSNPDAFKSIVNTGLAPVPTGSEVSNNDYKGSEAIRVFDAMNKVLIEIQKATGKTADNTQYGPTVDSI